MAPLPQNNTARLFFDYASGNLVTSREHTVAVRWQPSFVTSDEVQDFFLQLLNAFGGAGFRAGWRVIRCRSQAANATFSLPIPVLPALSAFVGTTTGGYVARQEAVEETFQGRSVTTGRRVDLSLYRAIADADQDFRVGMPAAVGTALATASSNGAFLCIDGTQPGWYTYINTNYNSYWERRLRGSA